MKKQNLPDASVLVKKITEASKTKGAKGKSVSVFLGEDVILPGGTSDFNKLENLPKYNNTTMNGDTNIPEVKTYTAGDNITITKEGDDYVIASSGGGSGMTTFYHAEAFTGFYKDPALRVPATRAEVFEACRTTGVITRYEAGDGGSAQYFSFIISAYYDEDNDFYDFRIIDNVNRIWYLRSDDEGDWDVNSETIATKSYVDGLVGNIETALHAINNGGN